MSSRQVVTVDAAVDTAIMAAGDVAASAVIPFPVSGSGVGAVTSLTLIDPDHNTAANLAGTLWLFKATVTPAAANAAHSISDADALKCIGFIPVAAGDVVLSALNSVACVRLAAWLPFEIGTGASIYGIFVVAATPTFAGGTLRFLLGIA
jgi:hypothetical protein